MPDIGKLKQVTLEQVHIVGVSCGGAKQMKKVDIATIEWKGTYQTKTHITPTENSQTVTPDDGFDALDSVQIDPVSPDYVGSGIARRTADDVSVSGATVEAPAGYYGSGVTKEVAAGIAGTPTATKGIVSNHSVTVTPSVINVTGYIQGSTKTGESVSVSAAELASGTKAITSNGTGIDVTGYKSVDVAVPAPPPVLQDKTVNMTPTESAQTQTVSADSGYDGLDEVQVNVGAIASDYVGSGIARRFDTDLSASGSTVTVPAGFYADQVSKAVADGSAGTPTASKGTVSNHSVTVTPSVTNSTGYISGGTKTGTGVTVNVSELESGTKSITANGTGISVSGYSAVDVAVPASTPNLQEKTNINPTTSSQTIRADSGYDGLSSVQINAMSSGTAGTPTATKGTVSNHQVSITPSVTNTTGYITGSTKTGTAVTVSASELVSGNKAISSAGNNIDVANYATASVAAGSAAAPATISGSSATVSTGSNTLTLTKTVSVTPVVSAGYVSSGTAGNASISLTANVTTQAAQTIHPSTSDQTIAASRYLTGAQTIKAVTMENLTADNIKQGVTVKVGDSTDDDCVTSVTGTYSGGGGGDSKNAQIAQGFGRIASTSYTAVSGQSIKVSKTGTYHVYWTAWRTSTSGTSGTCLYVDSSAHSSGNKTTWDANYANVQSIHLTSVSLTKDQTITVRARSRNTNYYTYVFNLTIIEA